MLSTRGLKVKFKLRIFSWELRTLWQHEGQIFSHNISLSIQVNKKKNP